MASALFYHSQHWFLLFLQNKEMNTQKNAGSGYFWVRESGFLRDPQQLQNFRMSPICVLQKTFFNRMVKFCYTFCYGKIHHYERCVGIVGEHQLVFGSRYRKSILTSSDFRYEKKPQNMKAFISFFIEGFPFNQHKLKQFPWDVKIVFN